MAPGDSDEAALAAQFAALRRHGPEGRSRIGAEMSENARRISLEGIRRRHPGISDEEARYELARLLYGDDLAARAWPHYAR